MQIASAHPDVLTAEYRVAKRPRTRVLVDYNQNAWGKTLASIYSVRANEAATVSTPVTWEELEAGCEIDGLHDLQRSRPRRRNRRSVEAVAAAIAADSISALRVKAMTRLKNCRRIRRSSRWRRDTRRTIPEGGEWSYEPKWDGFRCIAFRDGNDVELQSKSGETLTRYFPEIVAALLKAAATALRDRRRTDDRPRRNLRFRCAAATNTSGREPRSQTRERDAGDRTCSSTYSLKVEANSTSSHCASAAHA